jgi:hypothetical protein
MLELGAELG